MNSAAQQQPARSELTGRLSFWAVTLPLIPLVACLLVYWYGLRVWFQMDDFAWLSLPTRIHDVRSFLAALFQPLAQGTIRPWSERLYFLLGWEIARMESAGLLRAIAFATQFANLFLLSKLTQKLTGSAIAGAAASLLWICNSNLYIPMAWSSAYNQLMCACFLLTALLLWLKYTDTGENRWYWWQFVVFVLGFGALEMNVIYPVLAALAAWCSGRKALIRKTLPMFAVSVVYTLIHRMLAPELKHGIYRMYFDASLFQSLSKYIRWTFSIERYATYKHWPVLPFQIAGLVAGVAFVAFVTWMLIRKQYRIVGFGLGWFAAALAPVLPLRNHVSDYYLTIPVIGLAIIAGWGLGLAWKRGMPAFILAGVLALSYLLPSAVMARGMTIKYYMTSHRARTFIRSVAYADKLHPGQTLVIRHVDDDLFWAAWWDNPFQMLGRKRIYVSAEDEPHIATFPEMGTMSRFFLSEREALADLQSGQATAYELLPDGRLRNVTSLYRETLARNAALDMPKYINFGSSESATLLHDGWWQPEGNFRWSSGHASFTIRGGAATGAELVLTGICPKQHMEKGPIHLTVTIDEQRLPSSTITEQNLNFEFRYPLPSSAIGKPSIEVALDVDRTLAYPGDRRALGLAIASAEVVNPADRQH